MRESQIEAHLVQRVKALGGEVRKVKWIGRNSAPDRRVMLAGNCVWAEIKAPDRTPTKAQIREFARMRSMGETVFVLDSISNVDRFIEELLG